MAQVPQYHLPRAEFEGQGFLVPQKVYIPPHPGAPFTPQASIMFRDTTTRLWGIPLSKALRQDFSGLADCATRPTTTLSGGQIGVRILWPGYKMWAKYINTVESVAGETQHITKGRLAHEIAKKIRDFHQDMSTVQSTEANDSWWLARIPVDQLVLVELRNVARGNWQPVIIWRL